MTLESMIIVIGSWSCSKRVILFNTLDEDIPLHSPITETQSRPGTPSSAQLKSSAITETNRVTEKFRIVETFQKRDYIFPAFTFTRTRGPFIFKLIFLNSVRSLFVSRGSVPL